MDSALPIEAPLVIKDPEGAQWDLDCGLLVVGLGAAGASAAIDAIEASRTDTGTDTGKGGLEVAPLQSYS